MSELENINIATESIAKAKASLDTQHRNNLIIQSYLGELTHQKIFENCLKELIPALEVLKKHRPSEYQQYKVLEKQIQDELDILKPKPITPIYAEPELYTQPEKPVKTVKKRRVKK